MFHGPSFIVSTMQEETTPIFKRLWYDWTQQQPGIEPTNPLGQCWVPPIFAFYDQQGLLRTYSSPGSSIRGPHPGSPRGDGTSSGGVGFIVRADIKVEFHPLTPRTCQLDTLLKDGRKLTIISTCAPTNPRCLRDKYYPGLRDKYYEELDAIVAGIANRTVLVVTGDFDAKTGSGHKQYPENIGRYGKGHLNENGKGLLDFENHHDLVLTNTKFQHKQLHRTTGEFCLFVCWISLSSGQLIIELFPDCTRSCFSQVVSHRRGGDRIYEMRCLFVAVGPNARFIVLPHWDNMSYAHMLTHPVTL